MLDIMRRNSRSTIIYLIFGVIIVVFVFTFNTSPSGQGCLGGSSDYSVAKIAGNTVQFSDLNMAMQMSVEPSDQPGADFLYAGTRFGRFDPYLPDRESVKPLKTQKVMDELVETYLVSEEAKKLGLDVSEAELLKAVTERWFSNGRDFDMQAYSNQVRYGLKTSMPAYEDFERRELLRRKFIDLFTSQIVADPALVDSYFTAMNDKVTLEYIEADPQRVTEVVKVTDAEAQAWATQNADKIEQYYKDNEAQFNKPERVEITGVFKRAPFPAQIERAEPERQGELRGQRDAARIAADGWLAQVRAAAPSAPGPGQAALPGGIAQGESEWLLAQNEAGEDQDDQGGAAPVAEAEGTKPVEGEAENTPTGDAPAAGEAEAAPEADAAPEAGNPAEGVPAAGEAGTVDPAGVQPEAGDTAPSAPEVVAPVEIAIPTPAAPADVLADIASRESDHPQSKSTGGRISEPLSAEQLNIYPYGKTLADAAFAMVPGTVSEVLEVDGGFWIIRVESKLPAETKTLDQARTEIAKKLLQQEKAPSEAKRIAEELLASLKSNPTQSLDELVTSTNERLRGSADGTGPLFVSSTAPFGRMLPGPIPRATETWGQVPGVGKSTALAEAAFALTTDNPLASTVFQPEDSQRQLVVRLKERSVPEGDEAAKEKDQIRQQLEQFQRTQTYLAWYRELRRTAFADGDASLHTDFDKLVKAEAERRGQQALLDAAAATAAE